MKKMSVIVACLVLAICSVIVVNANDKTSAVHALGITIQELALIDLESTDVSTSISLNPAAPAEAGLGADFINATNSSLWLNYTSVTKKNKTRSITASIDGNLPGGTTLSVTVGNPSGNGQGALGSASSTAEVLTAKDVIIIKDIGSCYTGEGSSNGCNLTYKLHMEDNAYAELFHGNYNVVVTYTITEK